MAYFLIKQEKKMSEETTPNNQTTFEFPCDFTFKVMGKNNLAFEQSTLSIIEKQFPKPSSESIKKRQSRDGNYLALSITVKAKEQKQLDAIYQALSSHPDVLMAL